MQTVTTPAEL